MDLKLKNGIRMWHGIVNLLMALVTAMTIVPMSLGGSRVMIAASSSAPGTSNCDDLIPSLVPCLSYVQGQAKLPSKECCTNLLPIHLQKPQCLCDLILASSQNNSRLPNLNLTLTMTLGPACNINTDPSKCPDLLNLTPGSPEAKIFPPKSTATNSSTSTGMPSPPPPPPSSLKAPADNSLGESSGARNIASLLLATTLLGVSYYALLL